MLIQVHSGGAIPVKGWVFSSTKTPLRFHRGFSRKFRPRMVGPLEVIPVEVNAE